MTVITGYIRLDTKGDGDVRDLTQDVISLVSGSGLSQGIATVFIGGSTGAVTTMEYEPGLVEDLKNALERIAPKEVDYKHDLRWGDGNGHSHIRAALLGPSVSIPFSKGSLMLGTWQQVIFIDLDNRPRSRNIVVQIVGE